MNTISSKSSRSIRATAIVFMLAQASLFLSAQSFSFTPVTPKIVSARTAGYGGAYSATEAGIDTLSTNPAALAYVNKKWSISRIALNVSGPFFDIPSVLDADNLTTGILDLVGENNGVHIGAEMTGPIAFGKVDRNFGFGVFNRSIYETDVPSVSRGQLLSGEEFLLVGGYGLTFYEKNANSFSAGLQMKGFFQTFLYKTGTAVDILDTFTHPKVNGIPTVLSTGFGVDLGLMYQYDRNFSAAVTCKDLYTPVFSTHYSNMNNYIKGSSDSDTNYDRLDPNLTVGVAYNIPIPEHWVTITGCKVMLDYRDALCVFRGIYRNPWLNVAAGTEIQLDDILYLRAGIRDCYLSSGLGLDLSICQIDFAMYGSELGLEPGSRPLLNIALSASFEY